MCVCVCVCGEERIQSLNEGSRKSVFFVLFSLVMLLICVCVKMIIPKLSHADISEKNNNK